MNITKEQKLRYVQERGFIFSQRKMIRLTKDKEPYYTKHIDTTYGFEKDDQFFGESYLVLFEWLISNEVKIQLSKLTEKDKFVLQIFRDRLDFEGKEYTDHFPVAIYHFDQFVNRADLDAMVRKGLLVSGAYICTYDHSLDYDTYSLTLEGIVILEVITTPLNQK